MQKSRLTTLLLFGLASSFCVRPAGAAAPLAQEREGDEVGGRLEELMQQLEAVTQALDEIRSDVSGDRITDPQHRLDWYQEHLENKADSPFDAVRWRFLGPTNMSGRVTDVAVPTPRGKEYRLYVATATGGVWRSKNEGTSWEPIFEHQATTSIGALGLVASNPDALWVGTGEANIFRSSNAGAGIWRTLDGGESWEQRGLAATGTIARIVVHPADPDTVYVAASGCEWNDNPERGVYRTRDGGESWEQVLAFDERTGAIDLVLDPTKPEILYAASWQRIRRRWNDPRNEEGYGKSSIWRSEDGGDSWQEIADGLPPARYRGRIGIDLARSNPSVLYAFVDNYEEFVPEEPAEPETDTYGREKEVVIKGAEVYRSDDRGASWRRVSEESEYMRGLSSTYGWVFGQIRVDPGDEDRIYVMGLSLNVSKDGGQTFERLRGMHGDHHALWIDPENPDYLVNGNDGGVYISYDRGENWRDFADRLHPVQFYNVGYDMAEPFHVYGSVQDHGSRRGVVDLSRGRDKVRPVEFSNAPGGEASYHQIDPTDENVVYSAGFYGSPRRSDLATGERARLRLEARKPGAGEKAGESSADEEEDEDGDYQVDPEDELRGQWLAPFLISAHNPRILYHGMNKLFRSLNRGERYEAISPDLSRAKADELGDIPFQTISTIAESPLRFGLLYVGTDDGRAHMSPDSGASWHEITKGLIRNRWISRVVASQYDEDTVYLTQNGKRWGDFEAYVWRSRDRGQSWKRIDAGLPGGPVNVLREDPKKRGVLYVGTDYGVYVSLDGGRHWDALCKDLPTTYVHDLIVHPRDDMIVIATHGRGMWVADARPIQHWGEEPAEAEDKADGEAKAKAKSEAGEKAGQQAQAPLQSGASQARDKRVAGEEGVRAAALPPAQEAAPAEDGAAPLAEPKDGPKDGAKDEPKDGAKDGASEPAQEAAGTSEKQGAGDSKPATGGKAGKPDSGGDDSRR